MSLDEDVRVSCDDLAFSLTVWQSSNHSVAGYYPRMHHAVASSPGSTVAAGTYRFLDHWMYVWYHQSYSLVLPAGAFAHRQSYQVR